VRAGNLGAPVAAPDTGGYVRRVPRVVVLALALVVLGSPRLHAARGAVAAEHRFAAAAGAAMLERGGSVVDAAIAAAAAGCVAHPSSCGVGGGGFALLRLANGDAYALDFRERAPAGATPQRFFEQGQPRPERLRRGGLAVGVPGEVAGWVTLHAAFGRLPLAEVLAPAARLARDGFPLADTPHLRQQIARSRDLLAADPALRAVFLDRGGAVPGPDFRIVQRELAGTLAAVGRRGSAAFYQGPVARRIAATVRRAGGVLDARDLAGYRPIWRQPLQARVRGRLVVTFPPPGSGGVMLEALGLLQDRRPRPDAAWLRRLAGAMVVAFTDRARWYGDPAFTAVPVDDLLAPPRLARLRRLLRATPCPSPEAAALRDAGTANVAAVDVLGNAAVITTTINTAFGAGLMAPGTGVILNNEMDDFAVAPGVANAFGLVGGAANAVAPGKRPQSSMSPTIVADGARPELAVGASGGPFIVSGVLQAVLGVLAFDRDVAGAVTAPRIHDQGVPPALLVEPAWPELTRRALARSWCHPVRVVPALGAVSAAGLDARWQPHAAGDPRKDGGAAIAR
jgi:gamma-glutamyltranspeptidase/glutathione hydrolase